MAVAQQWQPNLEGVAHPAVVQTVRRLFEAVKDHDAAITRLATKSGTTTAAGATGTATGIPGLTTADVRQLVLSVIEGAGSAPMLGGVNIQTGSYTVQNSDFGSIVAMVSPTAQTVTLNPAVRQNFLGAIENAGTGVLTVAPGSGTVNGAGALTLAPGQGAWVFYDGRNWWAVAPGPAGFENPMMAQGDLITGGLGGVAERLALGSGGQVLTSNGLTASWEAVPSAVIVQSGTVAPFDTGPVYVPFPVAFPNNCLNVVVSQDYNGNEQNRIFNAGQTTVSGFFMHNSGMGTGRWIAVGN